MTNPIEAFDGTSWKEHEARSARVPCADCEYLADEGWGMWCPKHVVPPPSECEGCGQQKPIEEMQTCFLPGTGETYQCLGCRGLPTGGSPGCAGGGEP